MPASKVSEDEVLTRIAEVFRLYGYEGASIRLLSQATGLERASLYHRFPGGKEEMALAIIDSACAWLARNIFEDLRGGDPPEEKVPRVAAKLRDYYRRGTAWCVLDSMTLGGGSEAIREKIGAAYRAWLAAFEQVAEDAGAPPLAARLRAQQALVEIEGSLVVARVTGESEAFLRAIDNLPELLTATKGNQHELHAH